MQRMEALKARQDEMVRQAIQQYRRQLEDRVTVVTGGARGIGRAIAEGLLAAGAIVVVIDKSWDGEEGFRQQLEMSGKAIALHMDAADDAMLDDAYAVVANRFRTVDVLINNAALVSETLFHPVGHVKTLDTKDSDWEIMFRVNVFGVVKAIRRFIQPMIEKGSGSIINVISSGVLLSHQGGAYFGLRPWTVEMPYQATKAAVMALTFYLAEEVRKQGVAVNAIMPGHTRSSWFDATARAWSKQGMVYFQRPVVPHHVIPIVLFLATQDGLGTTGRLFYVPEWNYDHGYGDYAAWLDYSLPADLEEMYSRLEAVMPKYERAGVSHLPFDAWAALWMAAMERLSSEKGYKSS
jgi:NAD(P)-dependent dehydrogenase (short-subunit alcohol dehydrogenase family)